MALNNNYQADWKHQWKQHISQFTILIKKIAKKCAKHNIACPHLNSYNAADGGVFCGAGTKACHNHPSLHIFTCDCVKEQVNRKHVSIRGMSNTQPACDRELWTTYGCIFAPAFVLDWKYCPQTLYCTLMTDIKKKSQDWDIWSVTVITKAKS